jgi:hypothetical protein
MLRHHQMDSHVLGKVLYYSLFLEGWARGRGA